MALLDIFRTLYSPKYKTYTYSFKAQMETFTYIDRELGHKEISMNIRKKKNHYHTDHVV